MKNISKFLFQTKLTYKLATLCLVAIFAGNAQAGYISTYTGNWADEGDPPYDRVTIEIEHTKRFSRYYTGDLLDNPYVTGLKIAYNGIELNLLTLALRLAEMHIVDGEIAEWAIGAADEPDAIGTFMIGPYYSGQIEDQFGYEVPDGHAEGYANYETSSSYPYIQINGVSGTTNNPGTWDVAIPEPASPLLVLIGMAGLGIFRIRRNLEGSCGLETVAAA